MDAGDLSWLNSNFPELTAAGFLAKFELIVQTYPPENTDISTWTVGDYLRLIAILETPSLLEPLKEQEFLTDNDDEESPISEIDLEELDEVLDGCEETDRQAFKVALRYLKGEFTNVSLKA